MKLAKEEKLTKEGECYIKLHDIGREYDKEMARRKPRWGKVKKLSEQRKRVNIRLNRILGV